MLLRAISAPRMAARYSFVLREKAFCSSVVSMYRHRMFEVEQNPPMPVSLASVSTIVVGVLKTTLLIEMPSLA